MSINQPILEMVKAFLGGVNFDSEFDNELLIHINTAISTLSRFGVTEFNNVIVYNTTSWPNIVSPELYSLCRTYVNMHVKVIFDTPASATILGAYKNVLEESLLRIDVLTNELEEAI